MLAVVSKYFWNEVIKLIFRLVQPQVKEQYDQACLVSSKITGNWITSNDFETQSDRVGNFNQIMWIDTIRVESVINLDPIDPIYPLSHLNSLTGSNHNTRLNEVRTQEKEKKKQGKIIRIALRPEPLDFQPFH